MKKKPAHVVTWGNIVFDIDKMGENAARESLKIKKRIDKRVRAVRKRNAAYQKKTSKMKWNTRKGRYE